MRLAVSGMLHKFLSGRFDRPVRWHWRALVLWARPVRVEDVQVWLN